MRDGAVGVDLYNAQVTKKRGGISYNAFNFDNFSVQYGVCVCLCKERVHDTFVWRPCE